MLCTPINLYMYSTKSFPQPIWKKLCISICYHDNRIGYRITALNTTLNGLIGNRYIYFIQFYKWDIILRPKILHMQAIIIAQCPEMLLRIWIMSNMEICTNFREIMVYYVWIHEIMAPSPWLVKDNKSNLWEASTKAIIPCHFYQTQKPAQKTNQVLLECHHWV